MNTSSTIGPSSPIRALASRVALVLCLGGLLGGCASRPDVSLSPAWPDKVDGYRDVQEAWTRHGVVRKDYEQVLEVYATFKSPAWRAAYIERQARGATLSSDERALLEESQKSAVRDGPHEFELLVSTYEFKENDLARGENSVWRVTLLDDRGNQVQAESIVRDRRPKDVIRAEFPDMGDFAVAYIARFPRTVDVLRPDATRMQLELASPRGAVTLTWKNRQP